MNDHEMYMDYIQQELKKTIGAKTKSNDPIEGVVTILNFILNKNKRNFVFMFPSQTKNKQIEVTIRHIKHEVSTCVLVSFEIIKGYVKIIETSSKYGKCSVQKKYSSPNKTKNNNIDDVISVEMSRKIYSNVYKNFPLV